VAAALPLLLVTSPAAMASLETQKARMQLRLATGQKATYGEPNLVGRRLFPPNSTFRGYWDMLIITCLLFTAVVTPFEVAFLEPAFNALFGINRVVDVTFIVDMFITFMTPFVDPVLGIWVLSHLLIARNYLRFWFWIDFVSIIPFDLIALLIQDNNIKGIRLVRLLRLLKLFRIFRLSRILQRWEQRMTMKYSTLALLKFAFGMLMLAHWLSCLLALVPLLEGTRWSDLTQDQIDSGAVRLRAGDGRRGRANPAPCRRRTIGTLPISRAGCT
jgi:hypothetical protein